MVDGVMGEMRLREARDPRLDSTSAANICRAGRRACGARRDKMALTSLGVDALAPDSN